MEKEKIGGTIIVDKQILSFSLSFVNNFNYCHVFCYRVSGSYLFNKYGLKTHNKNLSLYNWYQNLYKRKVLGFISKKVTYQKENTDYP